MSKNLKYAPNLKIGDLVLATDGNWLFPAIVCLFSKTNKPYVAYITPYTINALKCNGKWYSSLVSKRWLVKITEDVLTSEEQDYFKQIQPLILENCVKKIENVS